METFLVILSDEEGNPLWKQPSEINGISKQEVYQLIAQDVPIQNIIEILTVNEYEQKYYNKQPIAVNNGESNNVSENILQASSDQFENGKDFFNSMLKAGAAMAANNGEIPKDQSKKHNKKEKQVKNIIDIDPITVNTTTDNTVDVKYFEEGGIRFKLENGILYKKVWKQVLLNGQKTPGGDEAVSEFRLVSATTKKLVSVEKVELQHLEWEEVKTN